MVPAVSRLRVLAVLGAVTGLVMTTTPALAAASPTPMKTWGTNGRVKAMVAIGGKVFLGGSFTSVTDTTGHSFPAARLAVVNAATGVVDRTWAPSASGDVLSLAVLGNTVYVGGTFATMNGVAHRNIAAVSATTGALVSSFRTTANKSVDGLAAASSGVVLAGTFTSVTDATRTTARTFLAKADPVTGAVDQAWSPRADARVRAAQVTTDGSRVFAGGDFTSVNGANFRSTVLLPMTGSGAPVSTYHGGPTNNNNYSPVINMDLAGTTLYVAAGGGGGGCTALNASTGARIWTKHSNGNVQDVVYNHGIVYCGGHFGGTGSFAGLTRYKMGAVNATAPYAVTNFAPRFNSGLGIWALAADSGHLFTGGDFTQVDHVNHGHFAEFVDTP